MATYHVVCHTCAQENDGSESHEWLHRDILTTYITMGSHEVNHPTHDIEGAKVA